MKLKLFILSILFFIATTVATIHELEHIGHDQEHASCEMCIVSHNFLSGDINHAVDTIEVFHTGKIESFSVISVLNTIYPTCQPRAPPVLS